MDDRSLGRRVFLKKMTALGAAGVPFVTGSRPAYAAYDPAARFELKVSEVEFRRNAFGRMLMARIYQPQGAGPFPTLLDLHGGAWNNKDRRAEEPMDRAIAASGVLVVAIDMTLAPEAPYPACVQDANYGVRWLKSKAASWNGDRSKIGVYGSSSGGHVAELLAMRPRDPRYNAIPLPEAPDVDADCRLRRDALAHQQHLRALPERGTTEARQHEQEQHDLLQPVGNDPRKQSAGNPRAPRGGVAGAVPDHAGRARRQRPPDGAGKIRRDV